MRRLSPKESLHGTRHGQLEVDRALVEAYSLTDRESAAAALLAEGLALTQIVDRLQITKSTAEKHLASLRRKMGVRSTTEAVAVVARFRSALPSVPRWPVTPLRHEGHSKTDREALFARELDEAAEIDAAVSALRTHLEPEGVRALCFIYLPMMAASFRSGDVLESWSAPARIIEAHRAAGGLLANPVALRILAEPDRVILVDMEDPASIAVAGIPEAMLAAARDEGYGLCVSFAGPFGCGFVGTSMFFRDSQRSTLTNDLLTRSEILRSSLMLALGTMYARGVLARTADLTLREREALTLIAEGLTIDAIAERLNSRPRTLAQLLKNVRRKLHAETNAAAVARAMALNALTFL